MSPMNDLLADAVARDLADPAPMRDRFELPRAHPGRAYDHAAYFAGHSLGLLPHASRVAVDEVMTSWSERAVSGHFSGNRVWSTMVESLSEPMAALVGAHTDEVVVMNTLTVNLHMLMAAFYRPSGSRNRIVIEAGAFPSDDYAVASQAYLHGLDPNDVIIRLTPRPGEDLLRTEDVLDTLRAADDTIALVLIGGINFRTGQLFDIPAITDEAHRIGAYVLWDLAHAAGNVPLALHDWDVDAAAWCTYKYVNSGPGAVGAAFIHRKHVNRPDLVILSGWWGNASATRFEMTQDIQRGDGALGWQASNPPILSLAPIGTSLAIFTEAGGMAVLRERSVRLTGYLEGLLDRLTVTHRLSQLTPRTTADRGAQLSVLVDDARERSEQLIDDFDVVPDERPPNVIRFAPIPLYSSYEDCWRAAAALEAVVPLR